MPLKLEGEKINKEVLGAAVIFLFSIFLEDSVFLMLLPLLVYNSFSLDQLYLSKLLAI